jgi:TatA/E family protein of Tat protein translocase
VGIENPIHLLFLGAVALVVLGPKRLPGLARALGQAVREFRASLEEGAQQPHDVPGEVGSPAEATAEPRPPQEPS